MKSKLEKVIGLRFYDNITDKAIVEWLDKHGDVTDCKQIKGALVNQILSSEDNFGPVMLKLLSLINKEES